MPIQTPKTTATDSRGRESKTLRFISISWLIVTIRFALAGFSIPYLGDLPEVSPAEYGAAVALLLTIWLSREWTEKVGARKHEDN